MQKYNKFIVAVIGTTIAGLAAFNVIDLTAQQATITAVAVQIITAVGVFFVPNKPA